MEDKKSTKRKTAAERDCAVSREGRFGDIRGRFWSTRDELTGEVTFHAELPNVVPHFQEDFDVLILVVTWNLWFLGFREKVWFRDGYGLSDEEQSAAFHDTTQFIGYAIEAWIHERGKLAFAEGIVDRHGNLLDRDGNVVEVDNGSLEDEYNWSPVDIEDE